MNIGYMVLSEYVEFCINIYIWDMWYLMNIGHLVLIRVIGGNSTVFAENM